MGTRLPVLILIAVAVSFAGCGGSSKSSSSSAGSTTTAATSTETTAPATTSTTPIAKGTGAPLSKSALVSRADAICKRLNTQLNIRRTAASDVPHVAAERAAAEQAALTELSKLQSPKSMAGDYEQMLKAHQTVIEDLKKVGEDAATGNTKAESSITASSAIVLRQLAANAQRNGFAYCGKIG